MIVYNHRSLNISNLIKISYNIIGFYYIIGIQIFKDFS